MYVLERAYSGVIVAIDQCGSEVWAAPRLRSGNGPDRHQHLQIRPKPSVGPPPEALH